MLLKIPFSFQSRGGKKLARSLLADWDFLPCVTVSVIAMSHFKDFMWVDGWSTTRERTVVKIPINEGQGNMTWNASGPYLPMTEPVDWNCIPSALGRGSALSVSAGRLHFPLAGSWLMPLSAHPGVHPVLTSRWWIHNFREKMNSSSSEILCNIIMQTAKSSWYLDIFHWCWGHPSECVSFCFFYSAQCRGASKPLMLKLLNELVCGLSNSCDGQLQHHIVSLALGYGIIE